MKVKVAVIGCGYWGPNLVRNLLKVSECQVAYACDVDEARLSKIKELYPSIETVRNYLEVLEDKDVVGVVVATPVDAHYRITKDALRADKHVLVEKPFVTSIEEAGELIKIADVAKRKIMVGYTFSYHPCLPIIRDIVKDGYLGKIYYVWSQRINLGLFQKNINVVWDLAPHDLSILKYIFGELPNLVNAVGYSHIIEGIEDLAFLNLKNEDFTANIHLSWLAPHKVRNFIIVGDDKMLIFDDVGEEKLVVHHRGIEKPDYFYSLEEFKFAYKYGKTEILDFKWSEPLLNQCREFINCIITNREPLTSARYSVDILKAIIAANHSIKESNKWRRIDDI